MNHQDINTMPTLFSALHKKMMERHHQLLSKYGLTKIHMPYLMVLGDHQEGLTQKEMIDLLFLDKAHASRALRDLVSKHMIYKDDETLYKNKYYILEEGQKIVEESKKETMLVKMKILESMTEDEIVLFRKLIERIIKILE